MLLFHWYIVVLTNSFVICFDVKFCAPFKAATKAHLMHNVYTIFSSFVDSVCIKCWRRGNQAFVLCIS